MGATGVNVLRLAHRWYRAPDPEITADLSKSEVPQNEQDNDDQTDDVDDIVHETFLRAGHTKDSRVSTYACTLARTIYPVGAIAHTRYKTWRIRVTVWQFELTRRGSL